MKKTISILLAVVFMSVIAVSTAMADGVTVAINDIEAEPGDVIEVPVELSGNTGFVNLSIEVEYDADVMTLTKATRNNSVGATYTPAQNISINPFNMAWDSTENVDYNGTLVTLTFAVSETAPGGKYDVKVSFYKGRKGDYVDGDDLNYDENYVPLVMNYKSGTLTVLSDEPTPRPTNKPSASGGGGGGGSGSHTGTTPAPTIKPDAEAKVEINKTTAEDGTDVIKALLTNVEKENTMLVVAVYDEDNKLSAVKIYETEEEVEITPDSGVSYKKIKALCWDKENKLKPVCASADIEF